MTFNLVIGGGAFGLFTTLELLSQNNKVVLVTDNKLQDSVSYNYTVHLSRDNFNLNFDLFNYNNFIRTDKLYDWFYMVRGYILNKYENKEYIYNKSISILEKYNIDVNHNKDKITLLYGNITIDNIINNIFPKYIKSGQLKIVEDTFVNVNNINNATKYDNINESERSKKKHKYTKPIYGFKMLIDSEIQPECLAKDEEILISKIKINNRNLLNVEGGVIIDKKRKEYHAENSNNYFDLKTKIKNSALWDKYKCNNIEKVLIGKRSVSIDGYPFYYKRNNIQYLEGGSFSGFMYAPLFTRCVVNNIKDSHIDFSIRRITKKLFYVNISLIIFVISIISLLFI